MTGKCATQSDANRAMLAILACGSRGIFNDMHVRCGQVAIEADGMEHYTCNRPIVDGVQQYRYPTAL